MVRSHFKYCLQLWSSGYRKEVIKLERVQKRFVRQLPGLEGLSYKESLDRLEFPPPKISEVEGDQRGL